MNVYCESYTAAGILFVCVFTWNLAWTSCTSKSVGSNPSDGHARFDTSWGIESSEKIFARFVTSNNYVANCTSHVSNRTRHVANRTTHVSNHTNDVLNRTSDVANRTSDVSNRTSEVTNRAKIFSLDSIPHWYITSTIRYVVSTIRYVVSTIRDVPSTIRYDSLRNYLR